MNGVDPDEMIPPGVPEQCRSCWLMLASLNKHVGKVESDVERVREGGGRFKVPPAVWALLWAIFLTITSSMMWVGSTVATINAQVQQLAKDVETLHRGISSHIDSAGHPVALERIKALEREVDSQRMDQLERGGKAGRK